MLNVFKLLANFFQREKKRKSEACVKLVATESWRIRRLLGKLTELINLGSGVLESVLLCTCVSLKSLWDGTINTEEPKWGTGYLLFVIDCQLISGQHFSCGIIAFVLL